MPQKPDKLIGGRARNTPEDSSKRGRPPKRTPAQQILVNLGAKIKAIREEQDLSVAQVAKRTGIAPQTIIQMEDNGRPIRFPVMYEIADSLGHRLEFRLVKAKG